MIRSGHHRPPLHDKFGSPFVERNFLLCMARDHRDSSGWAWSITAASCASAIDDRRLTPVGTSYACPSVKYVYTYSQVASGGPRCTPDRAAACCQLFDCENMQGGSMLDIHFYCPNVRRRIDTGIQVDQITFERTRLNIVHVPCPHCDRIHRFLMADLQIESRSDDNWKQLLARDMPTNLLPAGTHWNRCRRWLDVVERSRQEHSPARLANCSRTGELRAIRYLSGRPLKSSDDRYYPRTCAKQTLRGQQACRLQMLARRGFGGERSRSPAPAACTEGCGW